MGKLIIELDKECDVCVKYLDRKRQFSGVKEFEFKLPLFAFDETDFSEDETDIRGDYADVVRATKALRELATTTDTSAIDAASVKHVLQSIERERKKYENKHFSLNIDGETLLELIGVVSFFNDLCEMSKKPERAEWWGEAEKKLRSAKEIKTTTTARERVETELAELQERRGKLYLFVHSDKILKLSEIQQRLLRNQLNIMSWYIGVLQERLNLWEE